MRNAKAISLMSGAFPAREIVAAVTRPARRPAWRFRFWFARRQPTLFQRCLAVHIHHASTQRSLF